MLSDFEQEQIAEQIKKGFISGCIDHEVEDTGTFIHIAWDLDYEKWEDD